MSSKRITWIRLILFVILATAPMIVMSVAMNAEYGWPFWTEAPAEAIALCGVTGMFFPTIANILTRLFTREGSKDLYLGFKLRGNGKYYCVTVAVKLAEASGTFILIYLVFLRNLPLDKAFDTSDMSLKLATLIGSVISYTIVCFHAFGEEFGWRAYMMPKLIKLVGKPWAILIGGIIWGLWHAPLTVSGHNYGVEYAGFPYLGIVAMCVMCTLENAFLTLITERTKTVYPAAIAHGINNSINGMLLMSFFGGEESIHILEKVEPISATWLLLAVVAVTGIISFVIFVKKENKEA